MKTLNPLRLLWLPGLFIALALAGCSPSSSSPQPKPNQFNIGGTVSNLNGTVVLALNEETLSISQDGDFNFTTKLANNTDYQITIQTQPDTQECELENASGKVASADVSNVRVQCTEVPVFSIGGEVEGLDGSLELTLNGSHSITLTTGTTEFDFGTAQLKDTANYSVEISKQPDTQNCEFESGTNTGTVNSADVTSVQIQCETVTLHSIGGTVSGLTANLKLSLNGGPAITVSGNETSFNFGDQKIKFGNTYTVSIAEQPQNQFCEFTNNSHTGTVQENVTSVRITCQATFAVGGTIDNLNGNLVLSLNGGDTFTRNFSGAFTVPNVRLLSGNTYALTIETQPTSQVCTFKNNSGAGTVSSTDVTNIVILCTDTYSVKGEVKGLSGSVTLTLKYGAPVITQTLTRTSNGNFSFPDPLLNGTSYQIDVESSSGQNCNALPNGGKINGADAVVAITCSSFDAATLDLTLDDIKTFHFHWPAVANADLYQLWEDADGNGSSAGLTQIAEYTTSQAVDGQFNHRHIVPLFARDKAMYQLRTCTTGGNNCQISNLNISSYPDLNHLVNAIGYFKASNVEGFDQFGFTVSLSDDGTVMAVGAPFEASNATGVNPVPGQSNNDAANSGAVYVFRYDAEDGWQQEAYIKASNAGGLDRFGWSLDLSDDGTYLAVGAPFESSGAMGMHSSTQASSVQGDDTNFFGSGAVYLFHYADSGTNKGWQEQFYIKASNTDQGDRFGTSVSLNQSGSVLAIGAMNEDSAAIEIGGAQGDNSGNRFGAVYIYERDEGEPWQPTEPTYLKASHNADSINFGESLSLSSDGLVLAVGAPGDPSSKSGPNPGSFNEAAEKAGAVYIYQRNNNDDWASSTNHYLKASNPGSGDNFGSAVSLNNDGTRLAVGAPFEDGQGFGVRPNPTDDSNDNDAGDDYGAVYLFHRTNQSWQQNAYIKTFFPSIVDSFGTSLSLSGDGNSLMVGSPGSEGNSDLNETSTSIGINNDFEQKSFSGAVFSYVFRNNQWHPQSYIKASNTRVFQNFGNAVAISGDGQALAIGAKREKNANPINKIDHGVTVGEDGGNSQEFATGAVYLY